MFIQFKRFGLCAQEIQEVTMTRNAMLMDASQQRKDANESASDHLNGYVAFARRHRTRHAVQHVLDERLRLRVRGCLVRVIMWPIVAQMLGLFGRIN